jgi:hypothetical protein
MNASIKRIRAKKKGSENWITKTVTLKKKAATGKTAKKGVWWRIWQSS